MKKLISLFLALLSFSAMALPEIRTKQMLMQATNDNQTLISLNANTNQTLPFIDCWLGYTSNVFTVSATGKITAGTNTLSSFGIQKGTGITSADGTCTNTFPTVYTALPNVQVTQLGATNSTTNVVTSLTLSNFVWKAGAPNVSNMWSAFGTQ